MESRELSTSSSQEISESEQFRLVIHKLPRKTPTMPSGPSAIHNLAVESTTATQETSGSEESQLALHKFPRNSPTTPSGPSPIHNLVAESGNIVLSKSTTRASSAVAYPDSRNSKPSHSGPTPIGNSEPNAVSRTAVPLTATERNFLSVETMPLSISSPSEESTFTGRKAVIDLQEFAATSTMLDREILDGPSGESKIQDASKDGSHNQQNRPWDAESGTLENVQVESGFPVNLELAAASTILDREIFDGPSKEPNQQYAVKDAKDKQQHSPVEAKSGFLENLEFAAASTILDRELLDGPSIESDLEEVSQQRSFREATKGSVESLDKVKDGEGADFVSTFPVRDTRSVGDDNSARANGLLDRGELVGCGTSDLDRDLGLETLSADVFVDSFRMDRPTGEREG